MLIPSLRAMVMLLMVGGASSLAEPFQHARPLNQSGETEEQVLEVEGLRPLHEFDLSEALITGTVPADRSEVFDARPPLAVEISRPWQPKDYNWRPTGICYRPLYFEHVAMERYGQTCCCACTAPFAAGAHFFGTVAILPYKMTLQPTWRHIYALGYYRPGSPTPCTQCVIPFDPWALTVQTLTVSGLVLFIP